LTEWITIRASLSIWLAAAFMLLAGCYGGPGRSVLFSNRSLEEVKAAYLDVLTEEIHPSQIDSGFDPVMTKARLDRYCAALKKIVENSPDEKTPRGKLEDRPAVAGKGKGLRVLDECIPGKFWSNGVCRAQWTRVMDKLPLVGFARKEQASVSKEDDGRVKLTVWHRQRESLLSSVLGRRAFSWLWSDDHLVEKRRIAAVKQLISR
jgi:hypothetical protein